MTELDGAGEIGAETGGAAVQGDTGAGDAAGDPDGDAVGGDPAPDDPGAGNADADGAAAGGSGARGSGARAPAGPGVPAGTGAAPDCDAFWTADVVSAAAGALSEGSTVVSEDSDIRSRT